MFSWVSTHFLNPSLFWPAVGLMAVPILIHLINRLRYKRVRFAAIQFLLQSQKQNRRRVLIEHLLLLAARVLAVAFIGLLIARFVADPRQISMFQGTKTHHVLLVDDSGSMRDRTGDTDAFTAAREVIRKLAAEGAQRPETQKLTVLRMSSPNETLSGLSERDVDDSLLAEMSTRLDDLECTYGAVDVAGALDAVKSRLGDDAGSVKHLHVISDFRRVDWFDNKAAAAGIRALEEADIDVNLVRTVAASNSNLAVTDLSGDFATAAAGVPVLLTASIHNFGAVAAENVRLAVQVDGRPLPGNYLLERIDAGQTAKRAVPVLFEKSGTHRVAVSVESDALEADNSRRIAVVVADDHPVLVVVGSSLQDDGHYLRDALAADKSVTGYNVTVDSPEFLRRHPLDAYQGIYLVNVPDLPEDAVDALEKYVAAGGGLAWFLGDLVRPAFYNDRLYHEGKGLFPVKLGPAPARLTRDEFTSQPDIAARDNDLFRILAGAENPFIDQVFVNVYYPVDRDSFVKDRERPGGVSILADLRNRDPLMLESAFGKGRIVTSLTAAAPIMSPEKVVWTNWANGPGAPSFAVMNLELARLIARRDRAAPLRMVGEPIVMPIDRTRFRDDIEIVGPDDQVSQVSAIDPAPADSSSSTTDAVPMPVATYRDTERPGFYVVTKFGQSQQPDQQVLAYNVPEIESDLKVAADADIFNELGDGIQVTIQPAGSAEWIRSESPGRELRWILLVVLALLLSVEQILGYRLSYHSSDESSPKSKIFRRRKTATTGARRPLKAGTS
ncbi:hypothetical protein Pan44_24700 [Caulifigura coniformis]|uniref:Aerotolerance regulator N-terminal domain-containing protein n=1 Tax=Caulifigura coniformis TaxID=2527983 RepID=A0A517SEB0_9PLAN|nr:BatA domain-containing protein [Caulifigura coniformis]QDT54437.1 hypothetical protein Pan44_24700 [Caulifigura coniformis]